MERSDRVKGVDHFIKKINDINIRLKLIISYMFVVLLPVLMVGIILIDGMNKVALNNAMKESMSNASRLENRIKEIFSIGVDISDRLYTDKNFQNIISVQYKNYQDIYKAYTQFTTFETFKRMYSQIGNINFYPYNKTMLENWDFMYIDNSVRNSKWYKDALKEDGKVAWNYVNYEVDGSKQLTLSRLIKDISGNPMGILNIGFNSQYLSSVIKDEPFDTIITLNDYKIVIAKDDKLEGKNADSLKLDRSIRALKTKGFTDVNYYGRQSKANVMKFEASTGTSPFFLVSFFRVSDIVKDSQKVKVLGFGIISISLVIALALIVIFSKALSNRINKLSNEVDKVIAADFDADISMEVEGNDEIGRLASNIIMMVRNVRTLVYEVYEMDLQKKMLTIEQNEIQFKMLASQMNPHFLFNALESVRMKAHNRGEKDIANILKLFAKMLRRNLEVGKDPVPLQTEIDHVTYYLEIQKFRFGDRVEYEIIVEDDIEKLKILPFTLQPLVENAFVHGLEDKKAKGRIEINVKAEEFLIISIEDNGKGMEEETLQKLIASLTSEDGVNKSIGVRNVYQRFKLYYGDKFRFTIQSTINVGTRIEIYLPMEDKE